MSPNSDTSYRALQELLDHFSADPGSDRPVTDEQLVALHRRWNTRLATLLDRELELGEHTPSRAAVAAWTDTERDMPAVRALLDAHADRSALDPLRRHELRILDLVSGRDAREFTGTAREYLELLRATSAGDREPAPLRSRRPRATPGSKPRFWRRAG